MSRMSRIFIALLFVAESFLCAAQCNDGWVRTSGSPDAYDRAQAIVKDDDGNSYVAGQFNGTATFADTTVISNGSEDMFLAKYDPNGTLLWLRVMGASGTDNASDLARANDGSVLLCGSHLETCSIGQFVLPNTTGLSQGFVASYTGDGTVQWVTPITGNGSVLCTSLSRRNTSWVFVAGSYTDTLASGGPLVSAGGNDAFITALDPDGVIQWSRRLGGPGDDAATSVSDRPGQVWLAGYFRDSMVCNGITRNSHGGTDGFAVYYTEDGVMWAPFHQAGGPQDDAFTHIVATYEDIACAALQFSGTTTVPHGPDITSQGDKDACLMQIQDYGDSTDVLQVGGAGTDIIRSFAISNNGRFVITGSVQGDVTIGNLTLPGPVDDHCFYALFPYHFDVWTAGIAGGLPGDGGWDVAVNGDDDAVTIVGKVSGTTSFDGETMSTDTQGGDMFAWRLCDLANDVSEEVPLARMRVFPQPAASGSPVWFADTGVPDIAHWRVRSNEGRLVGTGNVNVGDQWFILPVLPTGYYLLELTGRSDRRVILPIVVSE